MEKNSLKRCWEKREKHSTEEDVPIVLAYYASLKGMQVQQEY